MGLDLRDPRRPAGKAKPGSGERHVGGARGGAQSAGGVRFQDACSGSPTSARRLRQRTAAPRQTRPGPAPAGRLPRPRRPAQAAQEVGPRGVEQVVAGQLARGLELVDDRKAGVEPPGHGDGDGPVERHHRRRHDLGQQLVQRGDLRPVGVGDIGGAGVARRDRRLQLVRAGPPMAQRRLQAPVGLVDLGPVPQGTVLVLERDQVARRVQAGAPARVMEQHQRQQAGRLGLVGHEAAQRAGEPDRLVAQLGADEVGAPGGRVPLVEQQIQHREDPAGALGQQMRGRDPIRDARAGDLALGAHEPLGHRRLRHQERPGDLRRGQPGQRAQGEGHPALQRQRRMTAGEDQPQPVVLDPALVGVRSSSSPRLPPSPQPRSPATRPAPAVRRRGARAGAGRSPGSWPPSSATLRAGPGRRPRASAAVPRQRPPARIPRTDPSCPCARSARRRCVPIRR